LIIIIIEILTTKNRVMKTQKQDLKKQIAKVDSNIAYCEAQQMPKNNPIYRDLLNRRDMLVSTLNNIK
jgi:flagellar hook-associated protein FlgK